MSESTLTWRNFTSAPEASLLITPPSTTPWTVYHSSYAVCVTCAGGARYRYRGAEHVHSEGAVLLFEPDELHRDLNVMTASGYVIAFLGPELLPPGRIGKRRLPAVPVKDPELVSKVMTLAGIEASKRSSLEVQHAVTQVTASLRRHADEGAVAAPRSAVVHRAREYLLDRLDRNVSLAELAALTGLTADHLIVSFKAATGLPPHAFQIAARVTRAHELIMNGTPATDAAIAAGFTDHAHFIRHYRRAYGVTPGKMIAARRT